jgi:hypothetical protein
MEFSSLMAMMTSGLFRSTRAHVHSVLIALRICSNSHAIVVASSCEAFDVTVKCGLLTSIHLSAAADG